MLAIDCVGQISDVVVMRHTDCGTGRWTDEGVRRVLRERVESGEKGFGAGGAKGRNGEGLEEMRFCESMGSEEEADEEMLRGDVAWLRSSGLVRAEMRGRIVGCVYETGTGGVRVVC